MTYTDDAKKVKKAYPVYLFHGTESYLLRQYTRQVIADFLPPEEWESGLRILDGMPTYAQLVEAVTSISFFGGRYAVLVRDAGWFQKDRGSQTEMARVTELLEKIPDDCRVVFVVNGKIDGRKKIVKAVQKVGLAIACEPLKGKDIAGWVQAKLRGMGRSMSPDAMQYFLSILNLMPEISLAFVEQELTKAALYTDAKQIGYRELTESMSAVPEASVFKLMEAVSEQDAKRSIELLRLMEERGEAYRKTLALLVRQVRQLWQVKAVLADGGTTDDIMRELGMRYSFIAEKLARQSRRFTRRRLEDGLTMAADAEQAMKFGRTDGALLEELVFHLCRK